ncbi:hypothetical protein LTR56_023623 [Elasticomyces elasticus]|nr:hypothetical protein LTR56_023623 [Elasticomyces elasticus]KAK3624844.1 hypothetical protein LTR22_023818 [Elasticomyces elasticus]KAK4906525.1 hypothetical protein LTR49_024331 [Elasticomyces elasticus]KAK5756810.1 hypothetical protein LTS12_013143 [Elasticomyces elasticus]
MSVLTTPTAAHKAIGFLDLPPEIRNIVYSLALHHEDSLQLDKHPVRLVNYRHQSRRRHKRELRLKQIAYINVSLLRVSRQVYNEAAPVLYGSNTFAFSTLQTYSEACLLAFLTHIGNSRTHLRRIKIGRINNYTTLRTALHLLKAAKQLDSFECSCSVLHKLNVFPGNVKLLVPWLKTLQKTARTSLGRKGALEVFSINPHQEYFAVKQNKRDVDRQLVDRKEQQRQIMAKLAEALA